MMGGEQELSCHNHERSAQIACRTHDSPDSSDSEQEEELQVSSSRYASASQGKEPDKYTTKAQRDEDTRAIIAALTSLNVEAALAAEAAEMTGSQGVAQALKWMLEERHQDPRMGTAWRRGGDTESSTSGASSHLCDAPSQLDDTHVLHVSQMQPYALSRPGTGCSSKMEQILDGVSAQSQRPKTAASRFNVMSRPTTGDMRRPQTAILKRSISVGDDGLGVTRPTPPKTPRLHSAFGSPSAYPDSKVSKVPVDTEKPLKARHIAARAPNLTDAPLPATEDPTLSFEKSFKLFEEWAPEATRRIISLQTSDRKIPQKIASGEALRLQTPLEPIPEAAWPDRPPAQASPAKKLHEMYLQALEDKRAEAKQIKEAHLKILEADRVQGPVTSWKADSSTTQTKVPSEMQVSEKRATQQHRSQMVGGCILLGARTDPPLNKIHSLTTDQLNKRALAQHVDPVKNPSFQLIQALAKKHPKTLLKSFSDIDPKQNGFVSRPELESLLRAWEIPIGHTTLRQILDRFCPASTVSTNQPETALVDYRQLMQTITDHPSAQTPAVFAIHTAQITDERLSNRHSGALAQSNGVGAHRSDDAQQDMDAHPAADSGKVVAKVDPRPPASTSPRFHVHTDSRLSTPRGSHGHVTIYDASSHGRLTSYGASCKPTMTPLELCAATTPPHQGFAVSASLRKHGARSVGRVAHAIDRAILARKSALALQEQVMANINPLDSKRAPTHRITSRHKTASVHRKAQSEFSLELSRVSVRQAEFGHGIESIRDNLRSELSDSETTHLGGLSSLLSPVSLGAQATAAAPPLADKPEKATIEELVQAGRLGREWQYRGSVNNLFASPRRPLTSAPATPLSEEKGRATVTRSHTFLPSACPWADKVLTRRTIGLG
jgi:hypothetical protein